MTEPQLHFPLYEPRTPPEHGSGRRRAITLGLSAVVTVAGLGTALYLGTLGYDIRRTNMHEARLKGILAQSPTVYQVTVGLEEKAPMIAIVDRPDILDRVIREYGGDKGDEIRALSAQWPQLRLYAAGDMTYFIYFDDSGIMKAFVYVSN